MHLWANFHLAIKKKLFDDTFRLNVVEELYNSIFKSITCISKVGVSI